MLHLAVLLLAAQSAAPAPEPVRVAIAASEDFAQPYYAEDLGIFRRFAVAAAIDDHLSGAAVLAAMEAGRVDVGWENCISAVRAIQAGRPLILLTAATLLDAAHPEAELMQAAHTDYHSGKDLNGKTIDSPEGPGSLGALAPQLWVDQHGGDSRTIKEVGGIPMSKVADALNSGQVAAAEMTEPQKTIHLQRGDVKRLAPAFGAIGSRFVGGVWVASKAWVASHPDAARHYVQAMREAAIWANAHPAESGAILVKRLKIVPAIAAAMTRSIYAENFVPALLQRPLDAAARYGMIKPVKAETLIENLN